MVKLTRSGRFANMSRLKSQDSSQAKTQKAEDFSINTSGEWRSLVSAPALGAGGRRFKSDLPDISPATARKWPPGASR